MIFQPKLFSTLKTYSLKQFYIDLSAGIIVGVVALPLSIAFGIASGVSPERGLITAIIGGFLISFLGGSRVQIGGPAGAFIVIVYGIVEQFGLSGLLLATSISGILLVLMGVFRLGGIIKFIPFPIVVGFTSGIAVTIFSSQIKEFFGLSIEQVPADFVSKWALYFNNFETINFYAMGISLVTLAIIIFWPKKLARLPGMLVAIILTTLVVYFFDLPVETIGGRFGSIPSSFPSPVVPKISFELVRLIIPSAFTLAVLGAIESLLSATVADGVIGGNHRSNTELVAQGAANFIIPFFGGIPATGAIARTMTNIRNGGRTPVAGIVHAVTLLLIMLFFGKFAVMIPMACLAGILVMVAYNMSEWHSFAGMFKHPKSDVLVLLTTFFLTVVFDLVIAIQVGLLMAMLLLIKRITETSGIEVIKSEIAGDGDEGEEEEKLFIPKGIEVYEINGPFFFGIANRFDEIVRNVRKKSFVRIIRLRKVPFMDSTGINNFFNLLKKSKAEGIETILSGVSPRLLKTLKSSGIYEKVGSENIYADIKAAISRAEEIVLERITSED
jgi:sulfate permease, SulP family